MKDRRQLDRLRAHLIQHGSITPMAALSELGIYRLSARVKDLRDSGMAIDTQRLKTSGGAVVAKYVYQRPRREMQQIEWSIEYVV